MIYTRVAIGEKEFPPVLPRELEGALLTVISRISTIQALGTKLQLLPESKVVVDSGSFGNCFSEKVERFRQFL